MNDLVGRIRVMTECMVRQRGRPVLIVARVPMSVERGHAIGLDVKTYLTEDLIDILILGGGYARKAMAAAVRQLIWLARPYEVSVFARISASGCAGNTCRWKLGEGLQ